MSSGLSMTSVNKIKELAAAREYSLAFDLIESQELSRSLNPQFLRLCGEVYVHMGEYEKARGTFIMARKLAPEAKRVMSDLVDLYYRAGYFELAETYYNIYMFDADSQNNETRQLAYIRAKALNKDNSEAMDELGEYYADNLDYDWSFELFLLYIKLGQTDKAKLLCRDYSASFKKSANAELMVQIIDGTEDVDKFFSVYATSSVTDNKEAETSPVWKESPIWKEEKKLLDADELRIHPKEPEITIMVDDDEELTLGDKRKFKKFMKEYEKAEKKAEEQQSNDEHSDNDEESEHVSADEPQTSQEETGKKSFFGKLFGKNKDKAVSSDEVAVDSASDETVDVNSDAVADETIDESKDEKVEESTDEVVDEITDEAVEENENDVVTEAEDVAESADTDETEEISEEVFGKISEEEAAVIEEAAEGVTEEVLEEALDDTADEITEEFLDDMVDETEDSSVDVMVSLGNELDSAMDETAPLSEHESESESETESESEVESDEVESEVESVADEDVAASNSSFVFNEVELMPEEDDNLEVDDFLQMNDEEYIEIELKLDSESKSEPEPEIEAEEEPESEPEPEPEIEAEEEPESESEPEPEIEVKEEPKPEPEPEHNNRSVFSPEVNSRVKDDYPVFRSSLFPDYNNERQEVSNNFDEMMDEAQSKMHDNMLKEEQMQREAEQLLASLGINLDDIQPSVSGNDEAVFSDLEMALDAKTVISRDELMKLIQIDDRKKDILRKLKEFR
jgi:hypothetical protein